MIYYTGDRKVELSAPAGRVDGLRFTIANGGKDIATVVLDDDDIFFHNSAVIEGTYDGLREGQEVEYTEGQGPKGPRAENVRPVE